MIDRKQERTNKFNRKKKFKRKGEAPPRKKPIKQMIKEES
jgi:hypothetical protein